MVDGEERSEAKVDMDGHGDGEGDDGRILLP